MQHVKIIFIHIIDLKATFYTPWKVGDGCKVVLAFFSTKHNLDLHMFFVKMIMVHNFETILHKKNELNPITKLWRKMFVSKLAKISIVQQDY